MSLAASRPRGAGRIAWQVPAAVSIGALALVIAGPTPAAVAAVALAAVAPELAIRDAREHRLPNRMTLPALVIGAVGALVAGIADGSWTPLIAAVASGGGMLVLSLLGGVGMGDAKLAALIGLASPTLLVAVAAPVLGMLVGGALGTVALVRGGRGHRIPLGPALLVGWLLALVLATGASST